MLERETWVCIKNTARCSRGDTNGVGEDEVTVTGGLHAQAERAKKEKEKRKLHPVEAQTKIQNREMVLEHGRLARGQERALPTT